MSYPKTLQTSRLTLRLVDFSSDSDCLAMVSLYQDASAGQGGNSRVGVNSISDARQKFLHHGAQTKPSLCTKVSPPPDSMAHLVYLTETNEHIGLVGCSFRAEMPWPDFGYMLFRPFWGKGYASEAGRAAVAFWRDVIGVREIWLGTMENNVRSQKTAEAIGFVRAGSLDIAFGKPGVGNGETVVTGTAWVLPGMEWKDHDEDGRKTTIRPTIGTETEESRTSEIKVPGVEP